MIELKQEGSVYVLHLNEGENRFNRGTLDGINRALDEVENSKTATALVSVGEGKFYSNGLDLTWILGQGAVGTAFIAEVVRLFGRLLTLGVPTCAAMNGHTFAAGAMLAMAHDFRVMRSDRGFFCIPEVDLKLPLAPGMTALLSATLPKQTLREALTTGKRYGADEALAKGIVDEVAGEADVLAKAIARVAPLVGKDRNALKVLKQGLYRDTLAIINGPQL